MQFDKSRVYTALNADELKVGSKCIFADTVRKLQKKVEQKNNTNCIETFYKLRNRGGDDLFVGNDCTYCYAYLIEPPAEPKYRPFENVDTAMEVIKAHGGWVENRKSRAQYIVIAKNQDDGLFLLGSCWYSLGDLFRYFCLADDGSLCGELLEE